MPALRLFLPALLSLILATSALAQSKTYTNGENNAGTLSTTGDITLTVANTDSATQSGLVSGTGSLTKTGDGTLALTNGNTYSGGTTINGGTLSILHSPVILGSNPGSAFPTYLTLNGGTLAMGPDGALIVFSSNRGITIGPSGGTLDIGGTTTNVEINSVITGNGSLTKTGTGTLHLYAHNTYAGGTIINAGTLHVGLGGTIFDTGSITVNAGARLTSSSGINLSSTLSVTGAGARVEVPSGIFAGYDGGTGTLNIGAGGTVTASYLVFGDSGGTGTLNLNAGGTLELSATSPFSLDGTANINFGGGTLRPTGSFSAAANATLVADTASVIDTNGFNATWSGVLSGAGALTKAGAGTLTLSGANTYTGDTTIAAGGTLLLGHVNALQDSTLTTATGLSFGSLTAANLGGLSGSQNLSLINTLGAAVNLNVGANNADTTYSGILLRTGSLTKSGTGTLTLSGANTYTGGTTVSAGTLTGSTSSLQGSITNHSAVVFNQASTGTYAGSMAGSGSLTKSGVGNLTLSGTNTYAGGTTVSAGTLTGSTTSLPGNIANNAAVVFDQASTGTYAGILSGTGSLTKIGAGSLTLSGANTHAGGTTVSGGTLAVSSDANLGASSGALAVTSGATFNAGTNFQTNRAVTLDGSGTQLTTNNGELVIGSAGTGSLALTNDASASTYNLTLGLNSGTGTVGLSSGGVITVNNSTSLSGTSTINLNTGGTLTTAGLSGSGTFNLAGGTLRSNGAFSSSLPATLSNASTVDTNGHATTLSGNLSGSGSLTKSGAGSLTLSGTNTYAGGTTVNAGTLVGSSDAKLGASSGALAVTSGATLNTGGDFRSNRAITVDGSGSSLSNNGELIIGNAGTGSLALTNNAAASAYNLTLAYTGGTGTLTLSSGSTVTVGNVTALDSASSTLNLNTGGTLTTFGLSGSGTFNFAGGTLRSNGALTSSLPATLTNTSTVDTNGYATTLSGVLSGSGSLTKSGTGTLTLSGTNTYAGGTSVTAGTLQLGTGGATGSVAGNITNNGTVTFNRSGDQTYGGVISGNGGVINDGVILRLSAAQTYTGPTVINSGILVLPSVDQGLAASTTVAIASGAAVDISNRALTVAGLTGAGQVYSFGGSAGHLTVNTADGQNQVFSGTLGSSFPNFALTKIGAGTLTLSGANTFTGATTLSGGALQIGAGNASGSLASTSLVNEASLIFNRSDAITYGGAISGSGALTQSGSGILTLSGSNTYAGATTVSTGTLTLGAAGALPGGTPVTLEAGATLDLNGFAATLGRIEGTGNVSLCHANLSVAQSSHSSYGGVISGIGGFTKTGAGTLTLSGPHTFTGATSITGGRLHLTGSAPGSAFTVSGGVLSGTGTTGTLTIASAGTLSPGASPGTMRAGNTTFAGGGSFLWEINTATGAAGANPGWDLLSITGSLNIAATSANPFTINLTSLTLLDAAGDAATFNPASNYTFNFVTASSGISGFTTESFTLNTSAFTNPFSGAWSIASDGSSLSLNYTASAIPEPGTYALFAGLSTLACTLFRKRRLAGRPEARRA